ncbi:MAG: SOS response-associated peptidase [Planctomycetota bacterium]
MCGRYQLRIELKRLIEAYNLSIRPEELEPFEPRYNVAPTQAMPVIRAGDNGRELVPMRWGLVPSWMKPKNGKIPAGWINARSETAATTNAFRAAFKRRRCLVPATGFYEWKKTAGSSSQPKQPYLIQMADGTPFAMAGLWETWIAHDGSETDTYAILTTSPNETMRPIHDRMPVILDDLQADRWLANGSDPLSDLMTPVPDGLLDIIPIDIKINSPRNEGPGSVERLTVA